LGEHRHHITDPDIGRFGAGKAGGHDVRAHQHLLVAQAVRHRRQVGLGVGHQYVLGLGAVDAVAETPAPHGLVAMALAATVLRRIAVLAGVRGEAGADGTSDDPLTFLVALHVAAQLLDDTHRLVTHCQALGHRVLTLEDVHVGAADGGGGDAYQRIVGANWRNGFFHQFDTPGLYKYRSFHQAHSPASIGSRYLTLAQRAVAVLSWIKQWTEGPFTRPVAQLPSR